MSNTEKGVQLVRDVRAGADGAALLAFLRCATNMDYYVVVNTFWSGLYGTNYGLGSAEQHCISYPIRQLARIYRLCASIAARRRGKQILFEMGTKTGRMYKSDWVDTSKDGRPTLAIRTALQLLSGATKMKIPSPEHLIRVFGAKVAPFSKKDAWVVHALKRYDRTFPLHVFSNEEYNTFGIRLMRAAQKLSIAKKKGYTLKEATSACCFISRSCQRYITEIKVAWDYFGFAQKEIETIWETTSDIVDIQLLIEAYAQTRGIDLQGFCLPDDIRFPHNLDISRKRTYKFETYAVLES